MKTNSLRSLYKIESSEISFDYTASVNFNSTLFDNYKKRLRDSFVIYRNNQNMQLPKGTTRFNHTDTNNMVSLKGIVITPESSLYPSEILETDVFKFVGQAGLDISFCKNDTLNSSFCSLQNSDLSFTTQTIKPTLTYWDSDSTFEIEAKQMITSKEDFARGNKGGIASLVDLSDGVIAFSLSDRIVNELDSKAFNLSKRYLIEGFKINISGYEFSSFQLCKSFMDNYTVYYLKLPTEILKTYINIQCN